MSFIKKIGRPLFAMIFLFVLIKKGPFKLEQLQFVLSQKDILITGLFFFLIQFFLFAVRWRNFVDLIAKISIKSAFRLTLIGQFFSFFIPGGVGGDVIKALELSRAHVTSKSAALSTVIADRVLGLFSMIFMSTLFLLADYFLNPSHSNLHFLLTSIALLIAVTIGLLFSPFFVSKLNLFFANKNSQLLLKIEKLVNSFNLTFQSFRNFKLQLKNFLISFAVQLISIYFMFLVVKSLQVDPPGFFIFFSLCCFGFLASAIPLTPAGIGVGQAAFYFLFSSTSIQLGEAAVTAVSVLQLFQLFFAIFGGILFSIKTKAKIE
jgi:glycosyltransferase 2 family protein